MYSKEERGLAKKLCESKEYMELIAKVFLEVEDKLTPDVVNTKTNEELGEIVRADSLAEQKIKSRYNTLRLIAQSSTEGKPKPAGKS